MDETNMSDYELLKERHRNEREHFSDALNLRVHRALSWLNKAEQIDDDDSRFIFLWIAFNAAYGQENSHIHYQSERDQYYQFIAKLNNLDTHSKLYDLVWDHYSGNIRSILNNEYIFPDFWKHQSGQLPDQEWQTSRDKAKQVANIALANSDTARVLSIIMERLYTLRNQIMHGGATYGSSANRQQLKDCVTLLFKLVPIVIHLMMDGQRELWGDAAYPLVQTSK